MLFFARAIDNRIFDTKTFYWILKMGISQQRIALQGSLHLYYNKCIQCYSLVKISCFYYKHLTRNAHHEIINAGIQKYLIYLLNTLCVL